MRLCHPVPQPSLSDARRCAYLKGWFAGFVGAGWPQRPASLPPMLEHDWDRGVHDARMARHEWRRGEGARR